MKSFKQFFLTEMPQYYPGEVSYMKDTKFTPISFRNIQDYDVLGDDGTYGYFIKEGQTAGFVFSLEDLKQEPQQLLPVMRLSLRPSKVKGYKQAHALRIREAFAKENITSQWYDFYVQTFGGIVSDAEHLEGGKLLWKHFIRKSHENPPHTVSLANGDTGQILGVVGPEMADTEIWSTDASKKNLVLVYELSQ